jgi:DNA topoisomerase I
MEPMRAAAVFTAFPRPKTRKMDDARERRLLRRLGLRKVELEDLSIERVACGRGFSFRHDGAAVRDPETRRRIADLVIPPAWRDVRIADDPRAHLQAVGRDEAGRLQYLYHPAWSEIRAARKVERLARLGRGLQKLRAAVAEDLAAGKTENGALDRRTMLAAAATLVDRAGLRAGHEAYAGPESGRGAATLLKRHVTIDGCEVKLAFPGKGGRRIEISLADKQLARVLGRTQAGARAPAVQGAQRPGLAPPHGGRPQRLSARGERGGHHRQGFPHLPGLGAGARAVVHG